MAGYDDSDGGAYDSGIRGVMTVPVMMPVRRRRRRSHGARAGRASEGRCGTDRGRRRCQYQKTAERACFGNKGQMHGFISFRLMTVS